MDLESGTQDGSHVGGSRKVVTITKLLEMGATWIGLVACWWAVILMQGGIYFTILETRDCLLIMVIFLFISFRHGINFCTRDTWYFYKTNMSIWAHTQQLELPIGFISGIFYWCKLVSAIICVVLSMMRLASQDYGKTKGENMATRTFALNVFYVLALIETLLSLLDLMLQKLFEPAREEETKEMKDENKKAMKQIGDRINIEDINTVYNIYNNYGQNKDQSYDYLANSSEQPSEYPTTVKRRIKAMISEQT